MAKQPAAAAIAAAVEGSVTVARSMPTPAQQNKKVMVIILVGGGMPSGFLQALARARAAKTGGKKYFQHRPAAPCRCKK